MSGFGRLSTEVKTGFVLSGVVIVALLAWALSLRAENSALRAELGIGEGDEVRGPGEEVEDDARSVGDEGVGTGPIVEAPVAPSEPTEPAAPAVPAAPPAAASAPAHLDATARRTLVEGLRTVPDGPVRKRVWFTVTYGDPRAAVFQTELARAFEEAGFSVARVHSAGFPIRPGLYFMMADEEPTEDVGAIGAALEAAGLTLTTGRGYRAYYEERKRADPAWNGFPMADDQPYVIAIGRVED
jgi:hypothetical protein